MAKDARTIWRTKHEEFDTLLAKYKDDKTDAWRQILLMKAML